MADVLNYLQAPSTSCIVVCAAAALWAGQTARGWGGEETTVKRRSECWGCGATAGDDWALQAAWLVQVFLMAHRPAPRETSFGEKRKRRLYVTENMVMKWTRPVTISTFKSEKNQKRNQNSSKLLCKTYSEPHTFFQVSGSRCFTFAPLAQF